MAKSHPCVFSCHEGKFNAMLSIMEIMHMKVLIFLSIDLMLCCSEDETDILYDDGRDLRRDLALLGIVLS